MDFVYRFMNIRHSVFLVNLLVFELDGSRCFSGDRTVQNGFSEGGLALKNQRRTLFDVFGETLR